jgi:GxxExxY protein
MTALRAIVMPCLLRSLDFGRLLGVRMDIEDIARAAVDCGFKIHNVLGPGRLRVERQVPISFTYGGVTYEDGFRVDVLVERALPIELKSIEALAPVHSKQLLTYLRLLELPLGLLINFGAVSFKSGVQRILNPRADLSGLHEHKR